MNWTEFRKRYGDEAVTTVINLSHIEVDIALLERRREEVGKKLEAIIAAVDGSAPADGRRACRKENEMYLRIESRSGKYNLANPSEESIQTMLCVHDDAGAVLRQITVTSEEPFVELGDSWSGIAEDGMDIIRDSMNRLIFDSQREEKIAFADFLEDNAKAINTGTGQRKLALLRQRRDELEKRIRTMELLFPVPAPADGRCA